MAPASIIPGIDNGSLLASIMMSFLLIGGLIAYFKYEYCRMGRGHEYNVKRIFFGTLAGIVLLGGSIFATIYLLPDWRHAPQTGFILGLGLIFLLMKPVAKSEKSSESPPN